VATFPIASRPPLRWAELALGRRPPLLLARAVRLPLVRRRLPLLERLEALRELRALWRLVALVFCRLLALFWPLLVFF
jgi:hypothetical protein